MGFIESYKHLEKLCGEILNDEGKISAYIDEMKNKPQGSYLVKGWDADLKKLKHYRWIRNKISHDPGCSEDNMCISEDAEWIDCFYDRIMNQTDPLALYYQATKPHRQVVVKERSSTTPIHSTYSANTKETEQKKSGKKAVGWIVFLSIVVLISILFVLKDYIF